MMLIEETQVPASALPVQSFRNHLRLGTGFADDGLQESLAESCLRAAISTIEGRIGKVLLARRFRLVVRDWRDAAGQALPLAPVSAVVSVTMMSAAGTGEVVEPARYRLQADTHRPRIRAVGLLLPQVPTDGQAEIVFDAGFGADWAMVPTDLAQAVMLLAAQFYENRHDTGGQVPMLPAMVQALVSKWRNVRVLGGGEA